MAKIVFTLGFKERDLQLSLQEEGMPKSKKIYASNLPKDPLIDFLLPIQTAFAKALGLGNVEFNQILIPLKKANAFFDLVQKEHVLFFDKTRISTDVKKKASFYFLVSDTFEVEGRVVWEGEDFSLKECSFLLPSEKPLFLWKNRVGIIDVSWHWLSRLQKGNIFVKDILDLDDDYPIKRKEGKKVEVVPLLKLVDPTFSFAELWFLYGDKRASFSGKEVERQYEKDLLEAGFQKRGLSYFCPLDKTADALQLLLDVGWRIEDKEERNIIPLSDYTIALKEEGGDVIVEGELNFKDNKVALSQAFPHIKDRPSLLNLGDKKAAFLHPKIIKSLPKSLKLPKSAIPTLRPLLEDKRVEWEEKVKGVIEGFTGIREAPDFHLPFKAKLYSYQQEGVNWLYFLYQNGFGGLLADEMGLGKTIQILAFFACLRTNLPILVVTPSSLIYNWKAEIERFIPDIKPYLHIGQQRSMNEEAKVILTTYSILRQDEELFKKLSFSCVVLDESSAIKNDASLTAQIAYQLRAEAKFALNGTPIENSLDELWSQFHFVQPSLLGDKKAFLKSAGNIKEKIRPFFLKRTKAQVDLQLPPKFEQIVWVEMEKEERELYEKFQNDAVKLIEEGVEPLQILEKILRLRQILCHPKLVDEEMPSSKFDLFMQDIEALYEQKSKVLIYSQFTQMLKLMAKEFEDRGYKYLYLDGETPPEERQKRVVSFQNDPEKQLFIISLKAGGVGLTLTAADYVILYDPWWNEAVEEQAASRAHRIGRDKSLIIKKYLTLQSIEENMLSLKKHKLDLANNLEVSSLRLNKEDWLHLLK